MARLVDPKTRRWLEAEAQKVAYAETGGRLFLSPAHKDLIARWRRESPEAVSRLEASNLLTQAALVLWDRWYRAMTDGLKAGMSPAEAQEQAARDWLDLSETSPLRRQDAPITS